MAPRLSAPFSTHARGVPLFDKSRFFDLASNATNCLLDLRDMSSSMFWFLSMQSWLTFWSLMVDIVAVIFFYYYSDTKLSAPLDWTSINFVITLPTVGFIWIAYHRRERSLAFLSEAKCIMLSFVNYTKAHDISTANTSGENSIRTALSTIVSSMHGYFLPSRFYSHRYPYLGYKSAMIQIALDKSRWQRDIRESITSLSIALSAASNAAAATGSNPFLQERCLRLSVIIDQMSNIKEYGTPQYIRSMARFYFTIIIPLFFAPYYAQMAQESNFAFAFFLSLILQIGFMGVLNASIALEDPWDNNDLGGVYIDEHLYEVQVALMTVDHQVSTLGIQNTGEMPVYNNNTQSYPMHGELRTGEVINGTSAQQQQSTGEVFVGGGGTSERRSMMEANVSPHATSRVVRVATDTV